MNDKMLDIIGLADEKYLHEAQGERKIIQTKHRRKLSAKVVAVAAAAAVMTVTASAYAVTKLTNKESVELYLEDAGKVESDGHADNQIMQNEHLRLTIDSVLSDGHNAMVIVTLDALDDYGRNFIKYRPRFMLKRRDNGETVFPTGGGGMHDWVEQEKKDTIRYYHTIRLDDKDNECDYDMVFCSDGYFDGKERSVECIDYIPVNNPLGKDFIAKVNFKKNVETVDLKSKDGKSLTLSQFELIGDIDGDSDCFGSFSLIKNDGTKEKLDLPKMTLSSFSDSLGTLEFGKYIELDDYKGVELCGVEYLKVK
ncbi:MAG: hypothetical protein J5956_09470 [Ruminococcus sp.]|nr:hypothetical protein [Ruminococcus sp.]